MPLFISCIRTRNKDKLLNRKRENDVIHKYPTIRCVSLLYIRAVIINSIESVDARIMIVCNRCLEKLMRVMDTTYINLITERFADLRAQSGQGLARIKKGLHPNFLEDLSDQTRIF